MSDSPASAPRWTAQHPVAHVQICPACGAGGVAIQKASGTGFACTACGLTRLAHPHAPGERRMKMPDLALLPDGARILVSGPDAPILPSGYDWTERAAGAELPIHDSNAPFDAMILLGHLETCADPVRELVAARAALRMRGLLYLDIGEGGQWRIPLRALRRLIERAGYRVVKRLDRFSLARPRPLRFWCRRY